MEGSHKKNMKEKKKQVNENKIRKIKANYIEIIMVTDRGLVPDTIVIAMSALCILSCFSWNMKSTPKTAGPSHMTPIRIQ